MITPLDVAISQVGIREATGHNDGTPASRYMRGDELPWCAGFVLYCYAASDWRPLWDDLDPSTLRDARSYWRLRAVDELEEHCQKAGIWSGPNVLPEPGSIVFFKWRSGSDVGTGRHVGMCSGAPIASVVAEGGAWILPTVEGNVSNKVKECHRVWPHPDITGSATTRML